MYSMFVTALILKLSYLSLLLCTQRCITVLNTVLLIFSQLCAESHKQQHTLFQISKRKKSFFTVQES